MGSKKNKIKSIENFRKLSIREQIENKQNIMKQLQKVKNDIVDREIYFRDLKDAICTFNDMVENQSPIFDKEGIYCTVDPGGHIEIDTDIGLPSKKPVKEFCAFLMKHFG